MLTMAEFLIKLSALLCLIPFTACGSDRMTRVDGALVPEIDRWMQDCRQNLPAYRCTTSKIDEIILVDELGGNTIGQCEVSGEWKGVHYEETRTILIERGVALGSFEMRALILHEVMHCQFDVFNHTEKGLMAPKSLPEWELKARWPELITEAYELVKK
jgi:hypothetical protein